MQPVTTYSGMELVFQTTNIGTYQPLMSLSHESGSEFRDMVMQVQQDDEHFLAVAEVVLDCLFASPKGRVAA